jgi:putative acetyltransferase
VEPSKSDATAGTVIRRGTFDDRPRIIELVSAVMGDEDAELVENIWASPWHLGEFELVAARGERVVGHILYGLGLLDKVEVPALAPLCVAADLQNQGIGSSLVNKSLELVDAARHPLVIVTGHWDYYPRFGFAPAMPLGIQPRDVAVFRDTRAFMARPMSSYAQQTGTFLYSWER